MIKLKDLLVETKQDSLARIMTDDTIKGVKSFLSSDEEFKETNNWYKYYDTDLFCNSYVNLIIPKAMKNYNLYGSRYSKKLMGTKGFVVLGNAEVEDEDEPGVYIRINLDSTKFSEDNLQNMQALYMEVLKVTRHEVEHIFQSNPTLATSGREKYVSKPTKPGLTGSAAFKDYRTLPTEIEADAKAINLLKKKQRISFEDATREFYQNFPMNKRDIDSMISKMLKYAKKFNFGGH
jgi:hypothetical protein